MRRAKGERATTQHKNLTHLILPVQPAVFLQDPMDK